MILEMLGRFDPGFGGWMTILRFALAITGICGLSALLTRFLARRDPATRYAIDLTSLRLILVTPVVMLILGRSGLFEVSIPVLTTNQKPATTGMIPSRNVPPSQRFEARPTWESNVSSLDVETSESRFPAPPTPAEPNPVATASSEVSTVAVVSLRWISGAFVLGWVLVSAWLLIRLLHGFWAFQCLRQRSQRVEDDLCQSCLREVGQSLGLKVCPEVRELETLGGPVAGGWLSPLIVLPSELREQATVEELRAILIHECAHIQRGDAWTGLVQRLAGVLFWPHPALHWLNRRLARAREAICDNHVLAQGPRSTYARLLVKTYEHASRSPGSLSAVLGLWGPHEPLEDRVRDILDHRRPLMTHARSGRTLASATVLVAVTLLTTGLNLIARAEMSGELEVAANLDPFQAKGTPGAPLAQPPVAFPLQNPNPARDFEPIDSTTLTIRGTVVDPAGAPVAGVQVNTLHFQAGDIPVVTARDGTFSIVREGILYLWGGLVASNPDGSLQGFVAYNEPKLTHGIKTRIGLKPCREILVEVRDSQGKPVDQADVAVVGGLQQVRTEMVRTRTDATGRVKIRVPSDARVEEILACKRTVGFDYELVDPYYVDLPQTKVPGEFVLTLDGASRLPVRVVDEAGQPVANYKVFLNQIFKPGKARDAGHLNAELTSVTTDRNGYATADFVPTRLRSDLAVSTGYFQRDVPDRMQSRPARPGNDVLKLVLKRKNPVSGRVIDAEGRPVPNALVGVWSTPQSRGEGFWYALTDQQGHYKAWVPPGSGFIVGLLAPGLAARPVVVSKLANVPTGNRVDLHLIPGATVTGRILGTDGKPQPFAGLVVRFLSVLDQGEEADRTSRDSEIVVRCDVDDAGRFKVILPPGRYGFSANHDLASSPEVNVDLTESSTRELDLVLWLPNNLPAWKVVNVRGEVVDTTTGAERQVPNAVVRIVPLGEYVFELPEATTGDDGRFVIEANEETEVLMMGRSRRVVFSPADKTQTTLIYAQNPEGTLAGVQLREKDAPTVRVALSKAAILNARLVDHVGNPIPDVWVTASQRYQPRNLPDATLVTDVRTDREGRFQIRGLIPGLNCGFTARNLNNRTVVNLGSRQIESSGIIEAGDVPLQISVPDPMIRRKMR